MSRRRIGGLKDVYQSLLLRRQSHYAKNETGEVVKTRSQIGCTDREVAEEKGGRINNYKKANEGTIEPINPRVGRK